ncbi:MAG TPA: flagellin [Candidatus Baltobacteraceae bacterium]|nr:flagellin [Candidatus Baltobacteraceae bacterium]
MAIANVTPDHALTALTQSQQALQTALTRESSGKRLQSAAGGPSEFAIATALQTQVAAFNAASQNVQTAFNATDVASQALSQTSSILSQLRTLAVAGVNDFLSPTDRAALQTQANQLVAQANTIAQTTNFNGAPLLSGQFAGANAGSPAQANVVANAPLAQGGQLVTQITAANANFQNPNGPAQGFGGISTQNSTVQVEIVAGPNGQAVAKVTAVDSATGQQITLPGSFNPGATVSGLENVNVKLGTFTSGDVGQVATIQIQQAVPPNAQNSALQVQSGGDEGNVTGVTFGNASAASLQIANADLSTSANSTNSIGRLDQAIAQLGQTQTALGSQQVQLQYQVRANDTAAVNLQTAQSNLSDANVGIENTNATLSSVREQLALAVVAQRNTQSAAVLTLFGR